MGLSSINTGLQQTPDLTDIQSVGKLSFQFISLYNAIGVLQQAIDTYTGNTPPAANQSNQNQPPEQTVIVGNTANFWGQAQVNINAGFFVTINPVGGQPGINLANATAGLTGIGYGISMTSATTGNKIQVLLLGLFNFGGGVTPGAMYYSAPGTPGGLTTTVPTGSGQLIQQVGIGIDSNSLWINPVLNPTVHP